MTTKKVSELTDEELDEQCALVQGWERHEFQELGGNTTLWWKEKGRTPLLIIPCKKYHPSSNTVEGRSQCLELMDKFKIDIVNYSNGTIDAECPVKDTEYYKVANNKNLQRAICEAVIMSVKGEEVEL